MSGKHLLDQIERGLDGVIRPADCTPATNHRCPNMKEVGGGFEGERYRCDVCGEGYYLDYEDMK